MQQNDNSQSQRLNGQKYLFLHKENMNNLRELFLLDPEVIFLNHGSFGATPIPVFEEYQRWQRELERQPVKFLGRDFNSLMLHVRTKLGEYLNSPADQIAMIPNATYGVNIVAHSIKLKEDDEILTTDQEYGACDRTWEFMCKNTGAKYKHQSIPMPFADTEEFINSLWQGVTEKTRLIFLSHITSPTATILPIHEVCLRARSEGILTLIDGAHAPGQMPLDLSDLHADFYTGNCHKWMLSPKGSAFLYSDPKVEQLIMPLIISWGWNADPSFSTGSNYIDYLQWYGTRDPAAHLAIPKALEFMYQHTWENVRDTSHIILREAIENISQITGLGSFYLGRDELYSQMAVAPIPQQRDINDFKNRLYEEFHIEIPCIAWKDLHLLRLSVQGYNTINDVDQLCWALSNII